MSCKMNERRHYCIYTTYLEKLLDHVGVHAARADSHHPHPVLGPGRAPSIAQTSDNQHTVQDVNQKKHLQFGNSRSLLEFGVHCTLLGSTLQTVFLSKGRFKDLCQQDNLRQHVDK